MDGGTTYEYVNISYKIEESYSDTVQNAGEYYWLNLIFVLVILVTITGNVMVVLAVIKNRILQNTTNYFLMSLAIADFLVAVIVMPINVISEIIGYFPFGFFVCNIWVSADILLCTSSIWHMCTMSMDRYFTIRFPLKYGRNKTRKFMLWKIVIVWLISILICSPILILGFVNPNNVYSNSTKICAPNHSEFKLYGSIFAFYIPFVIIAVTYSFTMRALKKLMNSKEAFKSLNTETKTLMCPNLCAYIIAKQRTELPINIINNSNNNNSIIINENIEKSKSSSLKSKIASESNKVILMSRIESVDIDSKLINDELYKDDNQKSITNLDFTEKDENHKSEKPSTDQRKKSVFNNLQSILSSNSINLHSSRGSYKAKRKSSISTTSTIASTMAATKGINKSNFIGIIRWCKSELNLNEISHNPALQCQPTMHLSLIKLNFSTSNNNQCSKFTFEYNLNSKQKYIDINQKTRNNYRLIFEGNKRTNTSVKHKKRFSMAYMKIPFSINSNKYPTMLYSSNSLSLLDTSSFIKSKKRVNELKKMQKVLFGIENEMETFLNNTNLNRKNSVNRSLKKHKNNQPAIIDNNNVMENNCCVNTNTNNDNLNSSVKKDFIYVKNKANFKTKNKLFAQTKAVSSNENEDSPKSKRNLNPDSHMNSFNNLNTNNNNNNLKLSQQRLSEPSNVSSIVIDGDSSSIIDFKCKLSSIFFGSQSTHFNSASAKEKKSKSNQTNADSITIKSKYNSIVYSDKQSISRLSKISRTTNYNKFMSTFSNNTTYEESRHRYNSRIKSTTTTSSDYIVRNSSLISGSNNYIRSSNVRMCKANNERKALKVLIIIFTIFVSLWTPFFIINLITVFCDDTSSSCNFISPNLILTITWLGYASSMANPIIYTMFNKSFRKAFINLLKCKTTMANNELGKQRFLVYRNIHYDYSRNSKLV